MANLVLTTKPDPAYDDLPEVRYHFPRTYLNEVKAGVGDWVTYYEPRRESAASESSGGRQCYFALARIDRVEDDAKLPDHYYAYVSEYLEFDRCVPFREAGEFYELLLRKEDGSTNKGRFGRAVRPITRAEFGAIVHAGFSEGVLHEAVRDSARIDEPEPETADRPIVEAIVSRPFRDIRFRERVRRVYSATCAMTGISVINGGGAHEVEAAHIRPVGDGCNGPDSVRNGLALSRTVHWLFDHGYLSVEDDYRILIAGRGVPEKVRRLLNEDLRLRVPEDPAAKPHRQFLSWHREKRFKGA